MDLKEETLTVLDLAQAELRSAYKRLGYSKSNVLDSIDKLIDGIRNNDKESSNQSINSENVNDRFQVRVSEILNIAKRQREINSKELTEIDFLDENGNIIQIDKKIVDDFRFCGLNNTDFITSEFYLNGWDEDSSKNEDKSEKNYSPYCKVCSGCGEEGCCSPMACEYSKDGAYCEKYLRDLKFGYLMHRDTHDFLKDDEESKKKIDEIFDKNWDLIYNTK